MMDGRGHESLVHEAGSPIPTIIAVDGLAFASVADALAHAKNLVDRVHVRKSHLLKARLRLGRFLLDLRPHVGYARWEQTLRTAGVPLHTARRAMRLARAVRMQDALSENSELGPIGSIPISDLDSRSLHSVEFELGVRREPAVVILERIEPESGCVSSGCTHGSRPVHPEPNLLIECQLSACPNADDPPAQQVDVQGEERRCPANGGLVIRDGPLVQDESAAQVSGQRLFSEVYETVERAKAEVNQALGLVASLELEGAAEVRHLLTAAAMTLGKIAIGVG